MVALAYTKLHTKFRGHRFIGSGEEDFQGFYHIWAWWPCCPWDQNRLNNLTFSVLLEATCETWLQWAVPQWFQKNQLICGRTDDGACFYMNHVFGSFGLNRSFFLTVNLKIKTESFLYSARILQCYSTYMHINYISRKSRLLKNKQNV